MAENFISSPEAPLQGELAAKQTERLYEDGAAREPLGVIPNFTYFIRDTAYQKTAVSVMNTDTAAGLLQRSYFNFRWNLFPQG